MRYPNKMTAIDLINVVLMIALLSTCSAFIKDHEIREDTNETTKIEIGGVFAQPINGQEAQSLQTADARRNLDDQGTGHNFHDKRHDKLDGDPLTKTDRRGHRSGDNFDDDGDIGRHYPSHVQLDRDPLHDSQIHRWASCLDPENCFLGQRESDKLKDGHFNNKSVAPISFVFPWHGTLGSDAALQESTLESNTGCKSFHFLNGKLNIINGIHVGDTATMYCNDGYKLHGNATVTCTASGEWSTSGLCVIVDCSEPPLPPGASVSTPNGTKYRAEAYLSCSTGFRRRGNSAITCQEDGTWSLLPSCDQIVTCDSHWSFTDCCSLTIVDGKIGAPQGTTFGNTATLSCDDGYAVRGSEKVKCTPTGKWDGSATCKAKNCGPLTIVDGKMSAPKGTTFGNIATMSCDDGYILQGTAKVKCTSTGKWDGSATCTARDIADCATLALVNGRMNAPEGTTFGKTATLSCDDGYTLVGNVKMACSSTGKWDGSATCQAKDCTTLALVNGHMSAPEGTTFGNIATLSCDDGYNLQGNAKVNCTSTGKWDGYATCKAKDCGPLTIVDGKMSAPKGTTFGNIATMSCDDGYNLYGTAKVKCTSTGKWDGSATCTAKDCGPRTIVGGKMSAPKGTKFGNTATLSCDDGYDLQGNAEVKCASSGKWDGSATCKAKYCLRPTIRNGEISVPYGTTFGKTAEITCNYGHTLLGDAEITCTSSGHWGGSALCVPRECGKPNAGADMEIEYYPDQVSFGDRSKVICSPGFYTKKEHIYCNGNGLWDIPYCQPIDCGPPPYIANGKIIPDVGGTTFRSTAQLTCFRGYEPRLGLYGRVYTPNRVYFHICSADGKWWTTNQESSSYVESSDIKCTDLNECASNPCRNNGLCIDEINGWSCKCDRNHGGKDCNTDVGPCSRNPCQNGGTCFYDARGVDYCSCTEHWENRICSSYHRRHG